MSEPVENPQPQSTIVGPEPLNSQEAANAGLNSLFAAQPILPGQPPMPGHPGQIPGMAFGIELRAQASFPYPPPEMLAGFNRVDASIVPRILERLDKEAEIRHSEQRIESEHRRMLEREGHAVQIKAMQEMHLVQMDGMRADKLLERRKQDQSSIVIGAILFVAMILGWIQGWEAVAAFLGGTTALTGLAQALKKSPSDNSPSTENPIGSPPASADKGAKPPA